MTDLDAIDNARPAKGICAGVLASLILWALGFCIAWVLLWR